MSMKKLHDAEDIKEERRGLQFGRKVPRRERERQNATRKVTGGSRVQPDSAITASNNRRKTITVGSPGRDQLEAIS